MHLEIGASGHQKSVLEKTNWWNMSLDKHQELRRRTKDFALRIMRMCRTIPSTRETNMINNQILRSATGIAANYRAVGLARSKAEFISKLGIVLEEADETVFWLELLSDSGIIPASKLRELMAEGNELVAIFLASRKTAKS
ncbi:MAG TPA: four helix bundle protein [Candidatus Angelobacter sp.]|nr:four helix bundle protein [Candidatus Angelobacter sp.]